jgi:hypothetical protein
MSLPAIPKKSRELVWKHLCNPLALTDGSREASRVLLSILIALSMAWIALSIVIRLPIPDPVDVVGPPLIRGYSERAEQLGFYAYLTTMVLASGVSWRLLKFMPGQWVEVILGGLLWTAVIVRSLIMVRLLIFCLLIWLAGRLATMAAGKGRVAADRTVWLWLVPTLAWGYTVYYDTGLVTMAFVVPVVAMALVLIGLGSLQPELLLKYRPSLFLLTAILLAVLDWWWGLYTNAGSLCAGLGFLLPGQPAVLDWLRRKWNQIPWWCLSIALSVSLWFHLNRVLPETFLLAGLNGIAIGLLWQMVHTADGELPEIGAMFNGQWWSPLIFATMATIFLWEACHWFLLVTGIAVAIVLMAKGRWRLRPVNGVILGGALMLAALPRISWQPIPDLFHDGQVLSAVWEFESGRRLFAEVFPLRLAEFFLVWVSRMIFPKSLCGSETLLQFAWPIAAAGGCLAGYAWTRSPVWSLAIGLLCSPWTTNSVFRIHQTEASSFLAQTTTIRDALIVLLLGLSMELLRSRKRKWWYAQSILGLFALFCGYDVMTAVIPPAAGAVLLASRGQGGASWPRRRGMTGLLNAALLAGIPIAAFTLLIGAWQGGEASRDYWFIFVDFARNYPAMIGNPLMFFGYSGDASWEVMVWNLLCLGVFAAGGVITWHRSSSARRRMWIYALLSSAIYLHRGLGRSDEQHVAGCLHLSMTLLGLLMFDAVRFLTRQGRFPHAFDLRSAGLVLLAGLAWSMRAGPSNPMEFASALASVPTADSPSMSAIPQLDALVRPGEFLFPVEKGMLSYMQKRFNPTRHAIAHCIGSPNEQRRAASDLERHRTPVVAWEFWPIDEISGYFRYYILMPDILRHYRPEFDTQGDVHWAVLAGPEWNGLEELPVSLLRVEHLDELPAAWGKKRWPSLARKVRRDEPASSRWKPTRPIVLPAPISAWEAQMDLAPRHFNYLLLTLKATETKPDGNDSEAAALYFSPNSTLSESPQITFHLKADGLAHHYLIPIGCHPAWTWRSRIRRLKIRTEPGTRLAEPIVRLLEIDDRLE